MKYHLLIPDDVWADFEIWVDLELLLTLMLCQEYEARYRWYCLCVEHGGEYDYEMEDDEEGFQCVNPFKLSEKKIFAARWKSENRRDEVDDYHPDGRYGYRTTGMRDGAMIW